MHMIQHLLIVDVAAILLTLGLTKVLLRPVTRRIQRIEQAAGPLGHPATALVLYVAGMWLWHVPALYDAALEHPVLHALEHVTLLGGALLLWWPIAGRLPEWPRPASLVQLLYLFLCTVPMTLAAAPITLADGVLYPFYLSPRAAWPLSPTADQEAAGILMWLGGTVGYLIAGTIVFFRWASREGGEEAAPSVPLAEDA